MSLSSSFNLLSFQRKVGDALQAVERTLELERSPRLAGDVEHTYGAKYGLVNLSTNAAIIAYMSCLEKLGLDASVLKKIDKTKPATLRFEASTSFKFAKEVMVDVPVDRSYETTIETTGGDASKKSITQRVFKAVNHTKEFHYEVGVDWTISIYSGTAVDEKKIIKSRSCKTTLVTQHAQDNGLGCGPSAPIDISLTWLLKQMDMDGLTSQFNIDTEDDKTKTPRRNDAVEKAIEFAAQLSKWSKDILQTFVQGLLRMILHRHNPALPDPRSLTVQDLNDIANLHRSIFNPILPLMEENGPSNDSEDSNNIENKFILALQATNNQANHEDHESLLSSVDISKLLNEHVRTLEETISGVEEKWSTRNDRVLSSSEASLSLLLNDLCKLSAQYTDAVAYVESMMESQLIAAIGKRLTPNDLEIFVKYHNARLLSPMPQPFSHAIRRPEHYPVGLLSIESNDGENNSIHSHAREVNATSSSLNVPLSAATVVQLTGTQYLHGWMNHRFGASGKNHQLVARARQFSSFILVMGNMVDGSTLSPKDVIIVQNKDELLIPLLLEELPTAKEFKDAVKSLSPEQQRFARAYRSMQLSSSVFGICIVQIKPQLEALLGLPENSLDKEMKLTQDLMELFVEYQVPSDLLSYNGYSRGAAVEDKISNVRDNVKGVLGVIEAEKDKQLKSEQAKTEMAMANHFQSYQEESETRAYSSSCFSANSYLDECCILESAPAAPSRSRTASVVRSMRSLKMSAPHPPQPTTAILPPAPPPQACMPMMLGGGMSSSSSSSSLSSDECERATTGVENSDGSASAPVAAALFTSTSSFAKEDLEDSSSSSAGYGAPPAPPSAAGHAAEMESLSETIIDSEANGAFKTDPQQQQQQLTQEIDRADDKGGHSHVPTDRGVDFTLIPKILNSAVERSEQASALRSTTIKTGDGWVRNRQENLLSSPKEQRLGEDEIKAEKNKAFDLLDALSRSGSLPVAYSELHVVVALTHCFEKDVMSTVVCDNINPIEKLEGSTLLLASAVHGVPAKDLIKDASELQRLEGTLPLLLEQSENN